MKASWKSKLYQLDQEKKWDAAISFMDEVIAENQDSVDAYLSLQYLIMNLLVEDREYDGTDSDRYIGILQKYFRKAYAKFWNNPAYLYYTGRTAVMAEWYFDLEYEQVSMMIDKAAELEPENKIYKWNYYSNLNPWIADEREEIRIFIKDVFDTNSPLRKELEAKGSVGSYIFDMMSYGLKRQVSHLRCIDKKELDRIRFLRAMRFFVLKCIENGTFDSQIKLEKYLDIPLDNNIDVIKMSKKMFDNDQFKDYQKSYVIMIDIISKYSLEHDDIRSSDLKKMTLVKGKKETVDPQYWNIWYASILKSLSTP